MANLMLSFLDPGNTGLITRISGKDEVRQYLSNLGFVAGTEVTIVSKLSGNLILKVKDARIAIDQGMARRIFVEEETK
ncbi:MAG: FeoA family protein [Butyricicoccus sp.]|nr:FeoA family protein [Butyricicoccus sp.]